MRAWGKSPSCACVPEPSWQGWWVHPALTAPLSPQDDTRPSQDSLPERTVVKLDTLPR